MSGHSVSRANGKIALVLHGGAGPVRGELTEPKEAFLRGVAEEARDTLMAGASAMDVVMAAVMAMEESGQFIAGKGSSPNAEGLYELDASIMDGRTRQAGAVSALVGFRHPVAVAKDVMMRTPHVMLTGAGAAAFAKMHGHAQVEDPEAYYTPATSRLVRPGELAHGTVGAVARDISGGLAAATSTGGLLRKTWGRVGDTPIIGAGTWADERVAVSCTGQGELFIRANAAADVSARLRYAGQSLQDAADGALSDVDAQNGDGGLIAVDANGHIAMPFVSEGMRRAWLGDDGAIHTATFKANPATLP